MSLIIECYHYLIVFQFYLKNKKLRVSLYFCQSPPLMKTLLISMLDTFVRLLPHILFDTEEHKVVIQLGPIKIKN